ncbi:protein-tyrosine phosphatase-like protein, partial [Catenaria anguillulae PL171]
SYLSKVFSLVDHPASGLRFLILDCPSDSTLPSVLKVFSSHNVTDVVRVCEPTYATSTLAAAGIQVHDLPFQDGGVPSAPLIAKYMTIVNAALTKSKPCTVAVHCIAGLGRAPLMVALALIEYGMPPLDAITYIRARRRGAFNTAQVKWIDAYKP